MHLAKNSWLYEYSDAFKYSNIRQMHFVIMSQPIKLAIYIAQQQQILFIHILIIGDLEREILWF